MEPSKYVLGIDPGTACGWAVITMDGHRLGSGVWNLGAQRNEGAGMRYLRLRHYLDDIALNCGNAIHAVAYEEVHNHAGTDAAHIYGGIVATVTAWCEELRIPYQGQPVGTVKKLATGSGAASKRAMVDAANERWAVGIEWKARETDKTVKDRKTGQTRLVPDIAYSFPGGGDNEADALWIAETLRRALA